jgi:hypothetical protein
MTAMAAIRKLVADHVRLAGNVAEPITVITSVGIMVAITLGIKRTLKTLKLVLGFPLQRRLTHTIQYVALAISSRITHQT